MTLLKTKLSQIPSDAVILTRDEAIQHQVKVMQEWTDKSDTIAFRYGGTLLAWASAAAGFYINNHYRQKFRLHTYGRLTSYLPIVVLPATLSLICHIQFVTIETTLPNTCAVCMQTRASAIQSFVGCALPIILAPLSSISLAMQYHTYNVPYITKEPMKVFKLVQKLTRPVANILFAIFVGQALVASVVTHFEMKSVIKVNSKLAKLEYDLDHSHVG